MARIRTIKPEFPQSESMGRVSRDARLLFVMLWPICDDHGRTRAASRMLASLLFPYDNDAPGLIGSWLDELEREGCITRYTVNGSTFLQVTNWLIHQKIDKPSKPQFPDDPRGLANHREDSSLERKGKEGKGEEGTVDASPRDSSAKPSRASRLQADWQPSTEDMRWAIDARPDINVRLEVETFRDYWIAKPGKDGTKTDWSATWRNWIRRANAPRRGNGGFAPNQQADTAAASRAL